MTDQGAAAARSAMAHDLILPDRAFLALPSGLAVPATAADAGAAAARRYVKFFGWWERHGLALPVVQPVHVAALVEGLG